MTFKEVNLELRKICTQFYVYMFITRTFSRVTISHKNLLFVIFRENLEFPYVLYFLGFINTMCIKVW